MLLAASTAATSLSAKSLVAHIPRHRRLSIVVVVMNLPDDVVDTANRRPTAVRVATKATEAGGELTATTSGVSSRRTAVSAVVVAGRVRLDRDGPLGAAVERRVAFLEDSVVDSLALGVDVHQDFAVEFLVFAAVELIEGKATRVASKSVGAGGESDESD